MDFYDNLHTLAKNIKTAKAHFFINQRVNFFQDTISFHPLNIEIELFGKKELSCEENFIIFKAVQNFITESKRFNRT